MISPGDLQIKFPKLVRWVEIKFCNSVPKNIIAEAPTFIRRESDKVPDLVEIEHRTVPTDRHSSDSRTIEITSEQRFDRISILRQESRIDPICYKTLQDIQNEEADEHQLQVNIQLFAPPYLGSQPVLKPGRYYRIVVQSKVAARLNTDRNLFSSETLRIQAGTLASDILNSIVDNIVDSPSPPSGTKSFLDEAYFQTDGPPTNLRRFIKWTTPQLNAKYFFRDNDFLIRFKRSYIRELFADDAFALNAYVRSPTGKILDDWEIHWSKTQSATLTPDEQAWLDHLQNAHESLYESVPKDDILRINNSQIADLSPGTSVGWNYVNLNPQLPANWQSVIDSRFGRPMQVMRQSHQSRAIAVANQSNCREFHFSTTIFSSKPNEIGVVFRYVDSRNYYSFKLNQLSSKQKLVKVVNGIAEDLLVKNFGFELNQLLHLSITANFDPSGRFYFEVQLDGQLWGEYSDNDAALSDGAVGLYVGGNNDANFVNPRLTLPPPLKPKSRFELILANGNAGELLFGDSYTASLLGRSFLSANWSFSTDADWQIDRDRQRIEKRSGLFDSCLILDAPIVDDVDIRSCIIGLNSCSHRMLVWVVHSFALVFLQQCYSHSQYLVDTV